MASPTIESTKIPSTLIRSHQQSEVDNLAQQLQKTNVGQANDTTAKELDDLAKRLQKTNVGHEIIPTMDELTAALDSKWSPVSTNKSVVKALSKEEVSRRVSGSK